MFYKICDPLGLKFLTARLRLGLSHINEHRFNYNFDSCVNPYVLAALNRNQETTLSKVVSTRFFLVCFFKSKQDFKSSF